MWDPFLLFDRFESDDPDDYLASMTRLARGLPLGATLEFADEVTLGDALKGRKQI